MPITGAEAAEVARRHGLGLSEAAGLRALADSIEEADLLAERFAPQSDGLEALLAEKVPRRPTADELAAADEASADTRSAAPLRSGSGSTMPLNGDPLERELSRKLGINPRRFKE